MLFSNSCQLSFSQQHHNQTNHETTVTRKPNLENDRERDEIFNPSFNHHSLNIDDFENSDRKFNEKVSIEAKKITPSLYINKIKTKRNPEQNKCSTEEKSDHQEEIKSNSVDTDKLEISSTKYSQSSQSLVHLNESQSSKTGTIPKVVIPKNNSMSTNVAIPTQL